MALLQWNCNGFDRHLAEIRQLLSIYAASVVCLQESRLHLDRPAVFRTFRTYTKDRVYQGLAAGGVTTFVRTDLYSVELPLRPRTRKSRYHLHWGAVPLHLR